MVADRTVINRRNVCSDVKSAYRADRDFLSTVLKPRVIAAAMNVLGLENKTGKPSKFVLPPNIENFQKSKKLEMLHELAAKVVDGFIFQDSSNLVDPTLLLKKNSSYCNSKSLQMITSFHLGFLDVTRNTNIRREGTLMNFRMIHYLLLTNLLFSLRLLCLHHPLTNNKAVMMSTVITVLL